MKDYNEAERNKSYLYKQLVDAAKMADIPTFKAKGEVLCRDKNVIHVKF